MAGEKRSEQVLRGCTKQEDMSYDSEGSPNPLPIVPLEVQAEEACGGEKLAEGEGLAVFSSGGGLTGPVVVRFGCEMLFTKESTRIWWTAWSAS